MHETAQLYIYLFGVLRRFQHCTGNIMTVSWKGRGNQYIQLVKVLYCKLPTNGKQLPAFPLEAALGIEPRPQRWEARVLPLCNHGPLPTVHLSMCNVRQIILESQPQGLTNINLQKQPTDISYISSQAKNYYYYVFKLRAISSK